MSKPNKSGPAKKAAGNQASKPASTNPKKTGNGKKLNTPAEGDPKNNRTRSANPGGTQRGNTNGSESGKRSAPQSNRIVAPLTSPGVKTIRSAKLIEQQTADVNYSEHEKDNTKTSFAVSKKQTIHPDLKRAFLNLRIHFAIMMDFIPEKTIVDITNVNDSVVHDFVVSGFSIGGKEDNPGVVLTGQKRLSNGKVATMNTPFERFEDKSLTAYKFMPDLRTKLDVCKSEILQYLEGKHAPDAQLSLFPGADEVPSPIDQQINRENQDDDELEPPPVLSDHPMTDITSKARDGVAV